MNKRILLFLILASFLNAKEYLSYSVGYLIESSLLKHDVIKYDSSVYNYAYRVNSVYLKQNYILLSDLEYYPHQNFAKGYDKGRRFTSKIEQVTFNIQAGLKKYIVPYTYFVPTLGLKYRMNQSSYKIEAENYKRETQDREFDIPLDINFGYSLTPTSDMLFGFNIDEDLTDLNTHDYQEYIFKYYVSFRNNMTVNAVYNKISKINEKDIKQVTDQIAVTIGIRF